MKKLTLTILVAVLGLAFSAGARAEVPYLIPVQGVLADSVGDPVDGVIEIGFAIYDVETAGVPLWSESQSVAVNGGFFTVYLGDVTQLPLDLMDAAVELWLGVAVGGDPEMNRTQLASVPYALMCENVLGDITPNSISVGGNLVVNSDGEWVGDPTGLVGPQGPQGDQGIQGEIGPQGDPGEDGVSVTATTLAPGDAVCEYGGTMFTSIDGDTYACNGAPGAQGPQGDQGIQGEIGPQGPQGIPGPSSVATCPSGFTLINLTRSTLCVYEDVFPSTWNSGQGWCYSFFSGASLCTYEQMRRACNHGGYALTASRWLADRVADDSALHVNGTDCNNFDGASATATSLGGSYCCLEWMKY